MQIMHSENKVELFFLYKQATLLYALAAHLENCFKTFILLVEVLSLQATFVGLQQK